MPIQNNIWSKRGVVVNQASHMHFIDHLAIIAIIMDAPFLFIDDDCYEFAKRYYPGLNALFEEYQEFSPEYMIENYDVSFMSDLWDRRTMWQKFSLLEQRYQKVWRNVHCPHGFSDKAFYLCKSSMEDILLIYGQNMIDMLQVYGLWENIYSYVICGNYRYAYYQQHAAFYKALFEQEILSQFEKSNPLILYAPTWVDAEQSTSFFEACSLILEQLPSDYNIIVKLHPRLELDDVVGYHQILGQHEHKKNVLFLTNYPIFSDSCSY